CLHRYEDVQLLTTSDTTPATATLRHGVQIPYLRPRPAEKSPVAAIMRLMPSERLTRGCQRVASVKRWLSPTSHIGSSCLYGRVPHRKRSRGFSIASATASPISRTRIGRPEQTL